MARTPPIANESDPSFLRKLEAKAAGLPVRPSVVSNPVVYELATQASTNNNVTITQSVNNDIGDVVTVYNTNGTINVTSIDQTINDYTTVDSGVSQIIAGENIVVTSTMGNGVGVVTISTSADPVFSASKIANGISNVDVSLNGPITMGVEGSANTVVINNTSLTVSGIIVSANANLGNAARANYFIGDGSLLTNLPNVGGDYSNSNVASYLPTYAGVLAGNSIGVTGLSSANAFSGSGAFLTNLPGANVTGTVANATYAISAGSANTANTATSATTANTANFATTAGSANTATSATTAGTVTANSQPNITSLGILSSLSVTGNSNISNLNAAAGAFSGNLLLSSGSGGTITGPNLVSANYFTGILTTGSQPNITSLGNLTTLTVTGSTNLGDVGNVVITGGSSGQVLSTNGSGNLSWITVSGGAGNSTAIINGNSSVVVELNGNVNTTINGVANILQINSGGANLEGNLTLGNGVGGTISGAAQIEADNFVLKKFNETVINGGLVSGYIEPDAALGTIYKYTLDGGITLDTIANAVAGTSMTIILKQDAIGGHSINSSNWYWSGNNQTLTSSPNAVDIVSVFYDGTDYYATLSNNFVQNIPF